MKRIIKNLIMILLIGILGISMYATMNYMKDKSQNQGQMQNQSQDQNSGGSMGMPGNESSNSSMEMPENQSQNGDNANEKSENVPDMPENGSSGSGGGENAGGQKMGQQSTSISLPYYIVFGTESALTALLVVYLIMSGFHKRTFKQTFINGDKVLIYVMAAILLSELLLAGDVTIAKWKFVNNGQTMEMPGNQNGEENNSADASGATTVLTTQTLSSETYTSEKEDESAILVSDGGNLTLESATVKKSAGDSSNTENSEFYGINAGILVQKESSATIKNTEITTNAAGSNAVFSTGENSRITISDSTIETTGKSSARGLDATYGGTIEASNVKVTTQGASCATLATDRGEGTVTASDSTLETNGKGSPIIYSTGTIQLDQSTGNSNGAQLVVVEGKNSATVNDSTLTASGAGNRGDVDQAGVMIYQSMSGDASEGTGSFTSSNSSLTIDSKSEYYKSAPMFFVTNTDAKISLTKTALSYGSSILLKAEGTSEWGNTGSNGGNVTLTAKDQSLEGSIIADKISTVSLDFNSSTYQGTINGDNAAKEISLKLDADSTVTLTGDSYVTSLEDEDASYKNINFNGYKLYVNGNAVN